MGLESAFEELKKGLKDLSSLEVRTYSGDITLFLDSEATAGDFKKLVDESTVKDGPVQLKLYTRLDADGDSDHFFATGEIEKSLIDSHVEAFKMGHEIRRAYLEVFKDIALKHILK